MFLVNEEGVTKSHIGEEEQKCDVYIWDNTLTCLNESEKEETPHARVAAAVRPARLGSARLGVGLGLGLGLGGGPLAR